MYQKFLIFIGFLLLFLLVSIVNFSISEPVFNSPDEASNYQVVREYGLTGKMYLTGEYLDIDYGNNLHPRGFITHQNKIVPFNFLGVPLVYGAIYSYFGDHIRFLNIIFIFITTVYLYKLAEVFGILQKKQFGYIFIGILGCLPLLYYFNFPYYNIVPFIVFIVPFLYYIFLFNKTTKIQYLYIGIFFALLSIWMRYEQVIFIMLFMFINMFYNYKTYFHRKLIWFHVSLILLLSIITFLIPLLILNKELYDNPFTYGYSLFTRTFFAEERTGGGAFQSLVNIFFPSQDFDLTILWINIKNNLFLISPLFFLFAYLFLARLPTNKHVPGYLLLCTYILLYAGMSPTDGSGVDTIIVHNSIQRYWLVVLIFLIFLFLLSLKSINSNLLKISTIFMIVLSNYFISVNYLEWQYSRLSSYIYNRNSFQTFLNPSSYILTTNEDKYLFTKGKTISWWCGIDCKYHFEKSKFKLAETIKHIISNGGIVYVLESKYFTKDYNFIEFERYGIYTVQIKGNLYKLYLKDETTPEE